METGLGLSAGLDLSALGVGLSNFFLKATISSSEGPISDEAEATSGADEDGGLIRDDEGIDREVEGTDGPMMVVLGCLLEVVCREGVGFDKRNDLMRSIDSSTASTRF